MKRIVAMILSGMMMLVLAACSGNGTQENVQPASALGSEQTSAPETLSAAAEQPATSSESLTSEVPADENAGTNMLVAYFSYAENADLPDGTDASASASIQVWNGETTGNTGVVAAMIAETTGADLFSIQTVEKYPDTYDATIDQGQQERNANARPALATHAEDLDRYDVVFLGFPKMEQGYICV